MQIASGFGLDLNTLLRANGHKPQVLVGGTPTFQTLGEDEVLAIPERSRLGYGLGAVPLPAGASQYIPVVTKDLLGDMAGKAAAGGSLAATVQRVANVSAGLSGSIDSATQALSTVQGDITSLISNGVTVANLTSASVASAVSSVGKLMMSSQVSGLGFAGKFLISVGTGIAGGAVGGPIGAAIGGFIGAVEAIAEDLGTGGTAYHFAPPTGFELRILKRSQDFSAAYATQSSLIGWSLYDYVAWNRGPSRADFGSYPICTPWLWGKPVTACGTPPYGFYQGAPPKTTLSNGQPDPAMTLVVADEPDATLAEAQLAASRAPTPILFQVDHGFWCAPPAAGMTLCAPNYPYLFALGTIFSMLAAGASDQAIAAELLMQQHLYDLWGDVPMTGQQANLHPLIDEFLARLPTQAELVAQATGTSTTNSAAKTVAGGTVLLGGLAMAGIAAKALVSGVGFVQTSQTIFHVVERWWRKEI